MRITARQLRQIIKEELSRSMMREADEPNEADAKSAVEQLFRVKKTKFPGPASKYTGSKELEHIAVARATCKDLLKDAGVAVADRAPLLSFVTRTTFFLGRDWCSAASCYRISR